MVEKIPANSEFFSSNSYTAIKKIRDQIKTQKVLITPRLLQKTRQEKINKGGRRSCSQNQVMADSGQDVSQCSANKYIKDSRLFSMDGLRWEWIHLVAHTIIGDSGQKEDNLVAGSEIANTKMLFVESKIPILANHYREGFTLTVTADLVTEDKASDIRGTHIAKKINWLIETKDFSLPFEFNAQSQLQPDIVLDKYIETLLELLVTHVKSQASPSATLKNN